MDAGLSRLLVTGISDECTACGACLLTCPEHALRPAPGRPLVLAAVCTGCGECVEICPRDAITLDAVTPGPVGPGAVTPGALPHGSSGPAHTG